MGLPKTTLAVCAVALLGACADGLDVDLRSIGKGPDTSAAARSATEARPAPDARGLISYPNYQVAIANRGDTVSDVAGRLGVPSQELASFNGLRDGVPLREGQTLVLPNRVGPSIAGDGPLDVTAIAGNAIERAGGTSALASAGGVQTGAEPVRHRVQAGETAFSIARIYDVTPKALADWNGLGSDMEVRSGEILLIPVAVEMAALGPVEAPVTNPGAGTVAPEPPSAAAPLPKEEVVATAPATQPASPQLSEQATRASKLQMPVSGSIVRDYEKGKNEGIGIAAAAGTQVKAAEAGTVAAITRDTEQVPIVVIRHENNLLTVYAGVDDLKIEKGDTVGRGQVIGALRKTANPFLHFEVRDGFESVDPTPYLN